MMMHRLANVEVKIVFSDKPSSLCLGVFADIMSQLGGIYSDIRQHFVSRTVGRATAKYTVTSGSTLFIEQ